MSLPNGETLSNDEVIDFETTSISDPNDIWIIEFDGSCSSIGSKTGIIFISPQGKFFPFSFKFQFDSSLTILQSMKHYFWEWKLYEGKG